jgi:Eukaryotic aspartyl protease
MYLSKIYVGSNKQSFDVHMDTGSNKLILLDKSCTECTGSTFDPTKSTSYVNTYYEDSIYYMDGSYMIGYKSLDTVAWDLYYSYKATSFNFLLGLQQNGFESEDGLIGLTRFNDNEYDMFIDKLYQQGRIDNRVFAFYMTDSSFVSKFHIGGYDTTYQKYPSEAIHYIPLIDNEMFWDVNVEGFRIGESDYDSNGSPMSWAFR